MGLPDRRGEDVWAGLLERTQQMVEEQQVARTSEPDENDKVYETLPYNGHRPVYYFETQTDNPTLVDRLMKHRTEIAIVIGSAVAALAVVGTLRFVQTEDSVGGEAVSQQNGETIQPLDLSNPEYIAPDESDSAGSEDSSPKNSEDNKPKQKKDDKKSDSGTKTPQSPNWDGEKFNFGTFNIFHSTGNGARDWQKRARLSVAAINRFDLDVVALQEARMNQQRFIDNLTSSDKNKKKKTDIFDIFPYDAGKFGFKGNDRIEQFTPNPIMWDRTKFSFIKYETTNVRYFGGSIKKAYAVLLENKTTGGKTWFVSFHDPADARGEAKKLRLSNAKEYKSWWAELAKTAPVVAGGDANSGLQLRYGNNDTVDNNPENLTCEVIVEGGTMAYASDVLKYSDMEDQENFLDKVHSDCSSTDMLGGDPIDLIFTSTRGDSKLEVHAYKKSGKGRTVNGSDVHPLYAVTLSTPNQ